MVLRLHEQGPSKQVSTPSGEAAKWGPPWTPQFTISNLFHSCALERGINHVTDSVVIFLGTHRAQSYDSCWIILNCIHTLLLCWPWMIVGEIRVFAGKVNAFSFNSPLLLTYFTLIVSFAMIGPYQKMMGQFQGTAAGLGLGHKVQVHFANNYPLLIAFRNGKSP